MNRHASKFEDDWRLPLLETEAAEKCYEIKVLLCSLRNFQEQNSVSMYILNLRNIPDNININFLLTLCARFFFRLRRCTHAVHNTEVSCVLC